MKNQISTSSKRSIKSVIEDIMNVVGNGKGKFELEVCVAGVTGSGKSTVLNDVCSILEKSRKEVFKESDEVISCTNKPKEYECKLMKLTMKLLDNPGFLDTGGMETEQKQQREVVENNFGRSMNVVLYTIKINERFSFSQQAVLDVFMKMYGRQGLERCIFVLTNCDQLKSSNGVSKEEKQIKFSNTIMDIISKNLEVRKESLNFVCTSKGSKVHTADVLQKIMEVVKKHPESFRPTQITKEEIVQYVKDAGEKYKINEQALFAAVTTVLTVLIGGGCSIL